MATTCGTVLLFLFLFALRAVYPTADPPVDLDWSGGLFFDEGMLVHGARNKTLFGSWDLDEWNDFYISPILSYIKWGVFSALGVGIAQGRLIPLFFSLWTLLFFYWAMKESFDRRTAALAVFLLGFDYVFIMFNRLGLTETALVFFMVLTAYLWQRGFRPFLAGEGGEPGAVGGRPAVRRSAFFLSGASSVVAHVFKSVLYFLPVPVVAGLLATRLLRRRGGALEAAGVGGKAQENRQGLGPIAWCLLGMAVPFVLWYAFFYSRHSEPVDRALAFYTFLAVPANLQQLLINVSTSPLFESFTKTPVTLLLSALGVGYLLHLVFYNRSELRPLDLFMLCWFAAHFVLYTVLNYRPVRHYVPVIPPICALAARGMIAWHSTRTIRLPERLSGISVAFFVLWLTWLLGYGVFPLARRFGQFVSVTLPGLPWERRMLGAAVMSVLLVGLAALVCWWSRGRSWNVPRRLSAAGFYGVLLAIVVVNGYHYYRWAAQPRYVIRDVSRELGQALSNALIAGLAAPMVVMENTHRALHAYPRFFNYPGTLDRYPVTHLFVSAIADELDFYYREFPIHLRRATPVKIYPIKESHFYLYSLVEPSIEGIRVSKDSYLPGEGITVTLAIKNRESTSRRQVTPGWILRPVNGASGDLTVTAASPIVLAPGETGEVTLQGSAAPGTYRLMAFAAPLYQKVLEAELLAHRLGQKEADPAASNGQVWRVSSGDPNRGHAVFGPYLRYPPGYLKAAFRLRADSSARLPVARIDIAAGGGRKILASRELQGTDFKGPGAYEEFELSSFMEQPQTLEFRVGSYKRTDLWIDRVQVAFTPGEWYERPITVKEAAR